jgi:hypothetical protein
MMTTKLRLLRKKNLLVHGLILISLIVVYGLLMMVYEDEPVMMHITTGTIALFCLSSFIVGIYQIKHRFVHRKVKVTTIKETIPYPQKFVDPLVDVGSFLKTYRHKKKIIPDYMIEFREGRTLYLYQMIQEPSDESYTILKINHDHVALVLDENKRKKLLHLSNVELVS